MFKKRESHIFLFSVILFLCFYYLFYGFQFGENNNREELPLIYELTSHTTLYPRDPFVTFHTNNYTQITPFLKSISLLIKAFGINDIKLVFFVLHLFSMILYFYISHHFLRKLVNFNPLQSAFALFLISLICGKFIPAGRWLFINFFDPEFLTIIIIFGFIYLHISKKYVFSTLSIWLAGLLYPIYIIPLFPALIFLMYNEEFQKDKMKSVKILISYASIPAFYTIFLWVISRQTEKYDFDASYIMEYIRAPWHYKIPSVTYMNKKAVGFFLLMIPTLIVARKLRGTDYWSKSLYTLTIGIFGALILTSIIHSIVRIPLIVQISPYRIGLFATMFAFFLVIRLAYPWWKDRKIEFSQKIGPLWTLLASLPFLLLLIFIVNKELSHDLMHEDKQELFTWILQNSDHDDLFVDYANVDVRTNCKRSSYFEHKTIPLTANGQMDWYKRFLAYNNYHEMIHPKDLAEKINQDTSPAIQTFGAKGIDKIYIAEQMTDLVDFVITDQTDTATANYHHPVFRNNSYLIFKH